MVTCHTALAMMGLIGSGTGVGFASFRPDAIDYMDDDATGGRCHWESTGQDSSCEIILEALNDAWTAQVDLEGWPAPFPDNGEGGSDGLDIYISTDAGTGAYTMSNYLDADEKDGRMGGSSYIVISPWISDKQLGSYVAHEFNHVVQYALDMAETLYAPWEGVAVVAEELTYPGQGSWVLYGRDYQATPWMHVMGDGYWLSFKYGLWSYYEYGSALFFMHMEEALGIRSVDFWMAGIQDSWVNEPDAWDAYDAVTGDANAALLDFAVARGRIGTEDAPSWAPQKDFDRQVGTDGDLRDIGDEVVPEYGVYDLGTSYVNVRAEGTYTVEIAGALEADWGIVVVGTGDVYTGVSSIDITGPDRIGVVNFGPAGYDSDNYFVSRNLVIRLAEYVPAPEDTGGPVEDTGTPCDDTGDSGEPEPEPEDTGDPTGDDTDPPTGGNDTGGSLGDSPAEEDTGGCGCASSNPTRGMAVTWLTLLAPLLMRRRQR